MADNFNQPNNVQMAVDAALQQEKTKKKKKKRTIILVIVGIIAAIIVISMVGGDSDSDSSSKASDTKTTASSEVKAEEKEENQDGKIGDYVCVVKKAEKCKDYEGKPAVKITYAFTNNSSESQSFDIALTDNVYQDGVGLEDAYFTNEDDDMGIDVKIKPGVTKDVRKTYLLQNETSDLEIEIEEVFSFSDDKLTETVKLK